MKYRQAFLLLAFGAVNLSARADACPPAPPSPAPAASAAPAPTPSPTPTPTPAPPSPSPTPIAANTPSPEESVLQFEKDWTAALAKHDLPFLRQAEADEYTYTDPAGHVSHKEDELARMEFEDIHIASFTVSDEKVQMYGDVAIVTGQTALKGTDEGDNITGQYRWTDIFIHRHGTWQVVASQAALKQSGED